MQRSCIGQPFRENHPNQKGENPRKKKGKMPQFPATNNVP